MARKFKRQRIRKNAEQAQRLIDKLPKPPRENGECACGCCHKPDRGPCPTFRKGANDRCVVCDHGILCHRRKGEAPPKSWNVPISFHDPRAIMLFPNDATSCPVCNAKAVQCPKCGDFLPIKEIVEGSHIARCPKCGGVDRDCPKAKV